MRSFFELLIEYKWTTLVIAWFVIICLKIIFRKDNDDLL